MASFTSLFCAVFLVFSALMVHHAAAQEMCHNLIPGNGNCDASTCQMQCSSLNQGTGACTQTFTNRFNCICNWECS
ncbi:hypothetical protein POPTR_016G061600v4 [Populus trichocarpa]|uniref:Knottin scorpion toxin-like domain-containing protein n=1 Tax=Populus trichocarpa TaxID=3694 RepID=B9IIC9_POPTR|nr:hypothetical protein POPTR_016G061600v4 [Populus trichocarpa]